MRQLLTRWFHFCVILCSRSSQSPTSDALNWFHSHAVDHSIICSFPCLPHQMPWIDFTVVSAACTLSYSVTWFLTYFLTQCSHLLAPSVTYLLTCSLSFSVTYFLTHLLSFLVACSSLSCAVTRFLLARSVSLILGYLRVRSVTCLRTPLLTLYTAFTLFCTYN